MSDETIPTGVQEPDDVARFLVALRSLGDAPAPAPAPAVAALIGGAVPIRSRAMRRAALRAGLGAAAVLAVLVGAAANHSLPQPAQRVVSNFVNDLTPFDIAPNQPPAAPTTPTPASPHRTQEPHERTQEPEREPNETGDGRTRGEDGPGQSSEPEGDSSPRAGGSDRESESERAPANGGADR